MGLLIFTELVAILLFSYLFWSLLFRGPTRHLPPGPKPLPIIGNLLDIPKETDEEYIWKSWAKHKDIYGALSYTIT